MRVGWSTSLSLVAVLGMACGEAGPPVREPGAAEAPRALASASGSIAPPSSAFPQASASAVAALGGPPKVRGRSPMPSAEEWASATKANVDGATEAHCDALTLREWLRVTCKGKGPKGGVVTGVELKRGGHHEAITQSTPGEATLVTPYLRGADITAEFTWADEKRTFSASWRYLDSKPEVIGRFVNPDLPRGKMVITFFGARSVTPHEVSAYNLWECNRPTGRPDDEIEGDPNPGCDAYKDDCEKLFACTRGDPSVKVVCREGTVPTADHRCGRICEDDFQCFGTHEKCRPFDREVKACQDTP